MTFYRQYMTQQEYDRIVNSCKGEVPPHCNQTMFHEPSVCAYCDGYYRANPGFVPESYVGPEANGWGGNQAPIVNDKMAVEEQLWWDKSLSEIFGVEVKERIEDVVERILDVFRRPKR